MWSPRPTEATLAVRSEGPMYLRHGFRRPNFGTKFGASVMGIGPYGEKGKHPQPPGPAAHSGAFAPRSQGMGGNRSRDHPQRGHQLQTIPQSRRSRDSSLCTREPWGTGDADCRVASLLAMTMDFCHSEEAQRAAVGIRPFYDGRGFGPPHERRGERHAESSCPTESPINHPSQPARSEASAPAAARDGLESAQRPSQKGDRRRDCRGSA